MLGFYILQKYGLTARTVFLAKGTQTFVLLLSLIIIEKTILVLIILMSWYYNKI